MERLTDIRDQLESNELMAKIAHIEEHWGDDEVALELLTSAMGELEKQAEAGAFGEYGISDSQLLSLGVQYASQAISEMEKEAEEAGEYSEYDYDHSEEEQEKLAEDYDIAFNIGNVLGNIGITQEDMSKLASADEDELAEFGEYLAHVAQEIYSE